MWFQKAAGLCLVETALKKQTMKPQLSFNLYCCGFCFVLLCWDFFLCIEMQKTPLLLKPYFSFEYITETWIQPSWHIPSNSCLWCPSPNRNPFWFFSSLLRSLSLWHQNAFDVNSCKLNILMFSLKFCCLASFTGRISWRHCGVSPTACRVSCCGHKIPTVLNFLEQVAKAEILLLNAFIQSRKGYELEVVVVSSLSRGSKLRGVEKAWKVIYSKEKRILHIWGY